MGGSERERERGPRRENEIPEQRRQSITEGPVKIPDKMVILGDTAHFCGVQKVGGKMDSEHWSQDNVRAPYVATSTLRQQAPL